MSDELVFFDLETGGLNTAEDAIIQIAAVAVGLPGYEELEDFEAKLRFQVQRAAPEALQINSYDADVWADQAIAPRDAIEKLSGFMKRHATRSCRSKRGSRYTVAELAGHNVAAFDMPFLRRYFHTFNEFFPGWYLTLDTLQLARWWVHITGANVENLKLPTLAAHFGMEYGAHDALADVRANVDVARELVGALKDKTP